MNHLTKKQTENRKWRKQQKQNRQELLNSFFPNDSYTKTVVNDFELHRRRQAPTGVWLVYQIDKIETAA